MQPQKQHIPELDGLRGIAALAVVVSHCANVGFLPSVFGNGLGQQGVALFYVLSGYLIFYLYFDREFSALNLKRYAIARVARVFPLFYAVVLIAGILWVVWGIELYGIDSLTRLAGNLLLIDGSRVLWSIPVEIQFYVLFIALWWIRTKQQAIWALVATLSVQAVLLLVTQTGSNTLAYWLHFFVIGGAAAIFRPNIEVPRWAGLLLLLLLPIALPELRRMLGWPVFENYIDPITAGYPVLLFLLVLWGTHAFRILAHPVMRYLGQISFGVYLLHWPLIELLPSTGLTGFAGFALVLCITVSLASLSLHLYERPIARRLRKRRFEIQSP